MLAGIRFWDSKRWYVYSAVVMPDHVHALARPLPMGEDVRASHFDLSDLLESVKGYTSRQINKLAGRAGSLWLDETFDRIVLDTAEFEEKGDYIRNNPVKAGLVARPEDYPWLYESQVGD